MLSLLKKKSDTDAEPATPAWHPNFRNYAKLPDIKVVRTAFFINGVALLVAASLALYLGFREWQLHLAKGQLAQVQAQIDQNKPISDQAITLFKKFQAEEAKINEVDAFVTSEPLISPLLVRLAETLPAHIALDNFDLRDTGLTLRFSVRGDATAASGRTTAYLEQLQNDQELEAFSPATYTSTPTRNPATGRMAVEFLLRAKPPGGKK